MREARGDLWHLVGENDALVITTNGFVKANGRAVMGRGIALEATKRFPHMPLWLGRAIQKDGNHVYLFPWHDSKFSIITMPVKHAWWQDADMELIIRSCHELVELNENVNGWNNIYIPRPGCGNGKLDWRDVKPAIEKILDDRFIAVDFGFDKIDPDELDFLDDGNDYTTAA